MVVYLVKEVYVFVLGWFLVCFFWFRGFRSFCGKFCKRYGFVVEHLGGLIRGDGYFESECRSWLWLFDMYMFL